VSISSILSGNTSPRERPARKQKPAVRVKINSSGSSKCPAACPSALEAAKALLGNNTSLLLSVSNARMTACTLRAAHVPNAVLLHELDGTWLKHFGTSGELGAHSRAHTPCVACSRAACSLAARLMAPDLKHPHTGARCARTQQRQRRRDVR
jgi:hypothetical protein